MKKCAKGHENPDNANFCRICGYEFAPIAVGQDGNETKLRQAIDILKQECKRLNRDREDLKTRLKYERNENQMLSDKVRMLEEKLLNSSHGGPIPPKPPVRSKYTPDVFPGINLSPRSVVKVDFKCRKGIGFIVFLIVSFVVIRHFKWLILNVLVYDWEAPSFIAYHAVPIISIFIALLLFIMFIQFLKRLGKSSAFRMNADYIETSAFAKTIFRIAKDGKLGLFDKSNNKVILGSQYDNITKFDSEHLLVEKGGESGLFSLKKMRIIVPVRYSSIAPFKNSVVKCQNKTEVAYYDVNGNRMR